MQPEVVLKETMRAAGDPRLTEWHEKLVQKGVQLKEVEQVSVTSSLLSRLTPSDRILGPTSANAILYNRASIEWSQTSDVSTKGRTASCR